MNILIDTSSVTSPVTGTGIYARELLHCLSRHPAANRVSAVGGEPGEGDFDHFMPGSVRWHRLINLHMLANVPNFKGDVAIFPNYFIPFGFSIPSVVTVHDISFRTHPQYYGRKFSAYYSARIGHSISRSRAVLTVSDASRQSIIRSFGVAGEKVHVIPPGPSFDPIRANGREGPVRRYFLYVGSIEPKKNILRLIEGFSRARIADFDLILLGRPAVSRKYFRRVQHAVSRANNVQYLGYIPRSDLGRYYYYCSGVVNISHIEGYSFPVRDAFRFGKPSMISRDPALIELCGGYAVQINERDIGDIADGFRKLAVFHRNAAFETYVQSLDDRNSWSTFSDTLVDLLARLLPHRYRSGQFQTQGLSPVQRAIIHRICYASVFDAPARVSELRRTLHGEVCPKDKFDREFGELLGAWSERFTLKDEWIAFSDLETTDCDLEQAARQNAALIDRNMWLLRLIRHLPWCRQLYFSGNSVHGCPTRQNDIDLFIVARAHRVWILFTLIRLVGVLTRKQNVICNNYMVDEPAGSITDDRDFYSAFELLHLQPVTESDTTDWILSRNRWIFDHFPNAADITTPRRPSQDPPHAGINLWPLSLLNILLMALWGYRWKKMGFRNLEGGLRWDAHHIKLHVEDHRPRIYSRLKSALEKAEMMFSVKRMKRTA